MTFLFVFPKYGIKVQMSNLTFEKLTKDDECPADIKINGYPGFCGGFQFLQDQFLCEWSHIDWYQLWIQLIFHRHFSPPGFQRERVRKGCLCVRAHACVFVAHCLFFLDYGGKYQGYLLGNPRRRIFHYKNITMGMRTVKTSAKGLSERTIPQENEDKCIFFWSGCF